MSRVIVVGALLLCISQLSAAPQSAITGQVTDSQGAVIARARVSVHWDPSGSAGLRDNIGAAQDVSVVTDDSGKYSANVPSGFCDVFVTATGFTPTAVKLRVKQGQRTTFNAELRADPLAGKELGDEFSVAPEGPPASDGTKTAKIVAVKRHSDGRIISWAGPAPIFDRYPFYDITLEWKEKRYTVRYESPSGYYPEDWSLGKEVQVQRQRGAFRIFRGTETVLVREVNVNDCVLTSMPTPGVLPQVPCD